MGVAKVEYYGRTLIDLTGDSVNPDVLAEGETAHDANGDLIVGRGVLNKGNFANALVGNVSGEMVAMDDVSPLEHKMPVKVKSKNLLTYPFADGSKTVNGMTYTVSEDGYVHATGTPTSNASYYFKYQGQYSLPSGTYTASLVGDDLPQNAVVWLYNMAENKMVTMLGTKRVQTFSLEQEMSFAVYLYLATDAVVNGDFTFSVQIEKGTTATAYTPYIADDEVITVRSCGKNLIPFPYQDLPAGAGTKTINGVTFTIHDDGTITASGTATSQTYFTLVRLFLPVGTYRLSRIEGVVPNGFFLYFSNSDYSIFKTMTGSGITIKIDKADIYDIVANANSGVVPDGAVLKPQLEIGDVTTDYEPYIEGETITTTLAGGAELTSIAPNMTIYTDKAGAIVECSYNKDTNIVIEKLTEAIIALGGNV